MHDTAFYLGAAAGSAILAAWLAWLATPVVRRLALRYGAAHAPRARDVHREPIPRWGGLAIYAAFVVSLLVGAAVVQYGLHLKIREQTIRQGIGLLLSGTLLTLVGAVDDRWELSAAKQIVVQ